MRGLGRRGYGARGGWVYEDDGMSNDYLRAAPAYGGSPAAGSAGFTNTSFAYDHHYNSNHTVPGMGMCMSLIIRRSGSFVGMPAAQKWVLRAMDVEDAPAKLPASATAGGKPLASATKRWAGDRYAGPGWTLELPTLTVAAPAAETVLCWK